MPDNLNNTSHINTKFKLWHKTICGLNGGGPESIQRHLHYNLKNGGSQKLITSKIIQFLKNALK